MRPAPSNLAEVAARARAGAAAFDVCLDEFLDGFYTETRDEHRQAMIDAEPRATGSARHDAYLAAVGEHLARVWRLRIPVWTEAAWREVASPWFVGRMGVGLSELFLVESPVAFRRRGIFTEAVPLRRARMPPFPGA